MARWDKNQYKNQLTETDLHYARTELQAGLLFARLAHDWADDPEQWFYCLTNAEKSYVALQQVSRRLALGPAKVQEIQTGIEVLRQRLHNLLAASASLEMAG